MKLMVRHVFFHLRRGILFALAMCMILSLVVFYDKDAKAADFSMQTGYYIGTGVAGKQVTGLGFQPDLVIIKSSTAAGAGMFKTSAMAAANSSYLSATSDNTATQITLLSDGFSVGTLANLNSASVMYYWTAFGGSDCSATGNFCVGTYNGTNVVRTITTGFQPGLVLIKRTSGVGAHFRTASMPANRSEYFLSTAADTTGNFIQSLSATGFTVGTSDNATGGVYNYIAFKSGSTMAEGTYAGTGVDGRNIAVAGFNPSVLFVKNSTSATANSRRAVFSTKYHHGDHTSYVGDAVANATNFVQELQTGGFQVGSGVATNENTQTFYWFGFAGGTLNASGQFGMKTGSYVGTGGAINVTGLGFSPDLVIIKDEATGLAAFRTSVMPGDLTTYLASTAASFTGGVTTLGSDGFTLGASTVTNTVGVTYHWQAFGGAHNPNTNSGAADFAVGAYYGNGIDNRNISGIPFQPDMVHVKPLSQLGVFRTSSHIGDLTSYLSATADSANFVQALNADGYQVGSAVQVNTSNTISYWFAFKSGGNFQVGSYVSAGGGPAFRAIESFRPDLVWVKRSTAVAGVHRSNTLSGDETQYFLGTANAAGRITALNGGGFTVGNQTEVSAASGTYRYVAWREAPQNTIATGIVDADGTPIGSPSLPFDEVQYSFGCQNATATFGLPGQKLRITSATGNPSWTTSIAATGGTTSSWTNTGATRSYDFNDPTGTQPGCSDGPADADVIAGQLNINPSAATITPEPVCSTTSLSLGSAASFTHGVTNAITLVSGASGADTECYWDITGITMQQTIPAEQEIDTYRLNLTMTVVTS